MGLNPLWQEDVFLTVQGFYHRAKLLSNQPHYIIGCDQKLFIHLVPIENDFIADELVQLQDSYKSQNLLLIHLWEDIWLAKRAQVLSRFYSFLALNESFHARKATILAVELKVAQQFLDSYHLQGYVKAKYHYGLMFDQQLIALASFSAPRAMKSKGKDYQSAELVRFASKNGSTIAGGLSKLIKHYLKQVSVSDLMSYADRDWSIGKGYDRLGFVLTETTSPTTLYLDEKNLKRYFLHRLPKMLLNEFNEQNLLNLDEFLISNNYHNIFNTGNLKYHLHL